jgi:hypothetical protein
MHFLVPIYKEWKKWYHCTQHCGLPCGLIEKFIPEIQSLLEIALISFKSNLSMRLS